MIYIKEYIFFFRKNRGLLSIDISYNLTSIMLYVKLIIFY